MLIGFSACKKCYNCERKCGYCTKNGQVLAGCEGDSSLSGYSVDSWKTYLEANGYTCNYNNPPTVSVCSETDKTTYTNQHYTCTSK